MHGGVDGYTCIPVFLINVEPITVQIQCLAGLKKQFQGMGSPLE